MTFLEILDQLAIPYTNERMRHVTEGHVGIDCPRCSPGGQRWKLGYNLSGNFATCVCWSCGHFSLAEVLVECAGLSFARAKELLKDLDREPVAARERVTGKLVLPAGLGPLLKPHRDYLKSRDFDPDELVKLWGVGSIGMASRLAWRIFIPVISKGRTVSWTTRSLSDEGSRYVNARPEEEAVRAKTLLMGEDFARHSVIVTEGPFDAMRIGPGAVSIMGMKWTKEQVAKVARYPRRTVVFDSDLNAQERARQFCDEISVFSGKTQRVEINAKDPGSCEPKEINFLRKCFL